MNSAPLTDTIAALSTPPGAAALAVVRVSGPQAAEICASVLRLSSGGKPVFEHKKAMPALAEHEGKALDRVVAVFFKAPQSYTGQDVVEISCHGSPYIKAALLQALTEAGARPAGPGEFTCRAFLNGKLDLAQAEGIAELISSTGKTSHRAALDAAEGKLSAEFAGLKEALSEPLAQLEARLDDADGEMPELDANALALSLERTAQRLEALASTHAAGKYIKEGVKTCITGAPNAGKSSLLNALSGFERAIVSPQPGTTRDTVEETLNISGHKFLLVDTAGLRAHAQDQTEQEGMTRTRRALAQADLALLVEDASCEENPDSEDARRETEDWAARTGAPLIYIGNKADLSSAKVKKGSLALSCKTKKGIPELRARMTEALNLERLEKDSFVITSARQFKALSEAAKEVRGACEELRRADPATELCADRLYAALRELEQLGGETTPEDILDAVFSKFCVGK